MKHPASIPANYEEHVKLQYELIALALQTDVTRVATFVLANEGSNKTYPMVGVNEAHHELSHHDNNPVKKGKIREINKFHTSMVAHFLGKLKAVKEGDGTLLDHCMIAFGSGNSDGNAHNHDDLPILVAGKGCGTLKTGRHVRFPKETPLANLWVSLLDRMDLGVTTHGDSTGRLSGI